MSALMANFFEFFFVFILVEYETALQLRRVLGRFAGGPDR